MDKTFLFHIREFTTEYKKTAVISSTAYTKIPFRSDLPLAMTTLRGFPKSIKSVWEDCP